MNLKPGLHPRNKHKNGYDFDVLTQHNKNLISFVTKNDYGNFTIDFSNPKAVKELKSRRKLILTGTPIENKPQDLASLLLQASPSKMFYLKDEKDPLTLKSIGSKFVLRRTKQDVLKELPDVVECVSLS